MGKTTVQNPEMRLLILVTSFVLGIVIQHHFHTPVTLIFCIIAGIVAVWGLTYKYLAFVSYNFIFMNFLFVSAGMVVFEQKDPDNGYLQYADHKKIYLHGTIDYTSLYNDSGFYIDVTSDSCRIGNYHIFSQVQFRIKIRRDSICLNSLMYGKLKPGTNLYVEAYGVDTKGYRNPGSFDYQRFLQEQGIQCYGVNSGKDSLSVYTTSMNYQTIRYSARHKISSAIDSLFSPEYRGLIKGLVLGDKRDIDEEIQEAFINAGVAHVLAVSGLNVAYVALMVMLLFGRFSLLSRNIITAIAVTLFWFICGNSPPVARAAIFALMYITAKLLNRNVRAIDIFSTTMFVVLLNSPADLFTASFQLSFIGAATLFLLYPHLQNLVEDYLPGSRIIKPVILGLGITVAAVMGIAPVTYFYFGRFSLTAFISNVIVVAVTNFIMGLSMFALLIYCFFPLASHYLALSLQVLVSFAYHVVVFLGGAESTFLAVSGLQPVFTILYYLSVIGYLVFINRFEHRHARLLLTVLLILVQTTISYAGGEEYLSKEELNIYFVDAGQGDAALICFPDGNTMLIDAGNSSGKNDIGKNVLSPLLQVLHRKSVDFAIVTHLDADHYKGFITLAQEGKIKNVVKSVCNQNNNTDRLFTGYLHARQIQVIDAADSIWKFGNARLYSLANKEASELMTTMNDQSLVYLLQYGECRILFMADAQTEREKILMRRFDGFLHSDVLKVAHHGSANASSDLFLHQIKSKDYILSAGRYNRYGHPAPTVLGRLGNSGGQVWRTDQSGAIRLRTDGKTIKIEPYKL